ncbi:MAG: ATP phosphoribosyltransferase regulatory subunit [Leptospirales bacterium]
MFSRIASFRRVSTARLLNLFSLWGYAEITLPAFEYLDSLEPGMDPSLLHKAYTLQDRGSGHVLILRPDATAQIARLVAQGDAQVGAIQRYSYSTSVFRHEDHHILERELLQTGVELFGAGGGRADWEILSLCLEGSEILGLSGPLLSLSHCGLQKSLLLSIGKERSPEQKNEIQRFFYAHDSIGLTRLLSSGSVPKTSLLTSLDLLLGQTYTVEDGMRLLEKDPIFKLSDEIATQSSRLKGILRLLSPRDRERVRVDFALSPSGPYYSGMFFHLYAKGTYQELASGGRYDSLPALFGRKMPATGFAFHMNRIEGILSGLDEKGMSDCLDIVLPADYPEGIDLLSSCANDLRAFGVSVVFWEMETTSLPRNSTARCLLRWDGKGFLLSHPSPKIPPIHLERPEPDRILPFIRNR